MKHLRKSFVLLILLTTITGARTFAQDYLFGLDLIPPLQKAAARKATLRKLEVIKDNEYITTGYEQGNFYDNPLMVNGKPIDHNVNLESQGELTVVKGAAITGETVQVPFYVFVRRDGNSLLIPNSNRTKIDILMILRYAKPGDQLIIEAVKKEDGPIKRIFKVLEGGGC